MESPETPYNSGPPASTSKRKLHAEDEPLAAPSNPPKRVKKTAGKKKKLDIIPMTGDGVINDQPTAAPSTSSSKLSTAPRQTSRVADSFSRSHLDATPSAANSPASQPPPNRTSTTSSTHAKPPSSTNNRKPLSTSSQPPPSSPNAKGKARQDSSRTRSHDTSLAVDNPSHGRSRVSAAVERDDGADSAAAMLHHQIPTDLSPARRTRQLLILSASGAKTSYSRAPESRTKALPTLSVASNESLKRAQDAILRMLSDGRIDVSPPTPAENSLEEKRKKGRTAKTPAKDLKPNPLNEKNRQRVEEWKAYIARAIAEEKIWVQLKASAQAQLDKLKAEAQAQSANAQEHVQFDPTLPLSPSKKTRKVKKPPEEWFPLLLDAVDQKWREVAMLARSTSELDESEVLDKATLDLLKGVELHVDELEDMVNTSYEMTQRAESLLHKFYSTVSSQLLSRATSGIASASTSASQTGKKADGMSFIKLLYGQDVFGAGGDIDGKQKDVSIGDEMGLLSLRAFLRSKPVVSSSNPNVAPSALSIAAARSSKASKSLTNGTSHAARSSMVERKMTAVPPRTPGKDREKERAAVGRAKTPVRRGGSTTGAPTTPGRGVKR
ncbi:hypothetical protein DL93DRAFT_2093161 [Clavulina sp. PMI_390]|nr:hypothetical protein DL93DRAFT_2093161 [Clavulina sp. PMI_390]